MTDGFLSLLCSPQTVSSSGHGRSESPVYTNLQELKITQTNMPPLPSGSPLHSMGDWETYKDQNGRHYYYNRSTQERTWKPPRTRETSTGSYRGESNSAGESSEVLVVKRVRETRAHFRSYVYLCVPNIQLPVAVLWRFSRSWVSPMIQAS